MVGFGFSIFGDWKHILVITAFLEPLLIDARANVLQKDLDRRALALLFSLAVAFGDFLPIHGDCGQEAHLGVLVLVVFLVLVLRDAVEELSSNLRDEREAIFLRALDCVQPEFVLADHHVELADFVLHHFHELLVLELDLFTVVLLLLHRGVIDEGVARMHILVVLHEDLLEVLDLLVEVIQVDFKSENGRLQS